MIIRKSKSAYRCSIIKELGEDCTGKQVLDHLFGDYDNDYQSYENYYISEWCSDKRKWWQRLNMFWAMPLTIIILPFQWVVVGHTGWSDKNKVGRFVLRVTGNLN